MALPITLAAPQPSPCPPIPYRLQQMSVSGAQHSSLTLATVDKLRPSGGGVGGAGQAGPWEAKGALPGRISAALT